MVRVLVTATILLLLGGASVSASETQALIAVGPDYRPSSEPLDAELFHFGGFTWIRTERAVNDIQADGAVRWAFMGAHRDDRFFLVGDDVGHLIQTLDLEKVGTIDGMQILRLPGTANVVVPHILAFHEIQPIGELTDPTDPYTILRNPTVQSIVDAVDSDSLHALLLELSSIQTRFCRSSYYEVAAQSAEERLELLGWPVESQPVSADGYPSRNLIATKLGDMSPDTVVVLCGHLDSATYASFDDPDARAPGADDNGSTSVAILEAARILGPYSFRYTIKLVLFAAEEIGLYGSEVFADNAAAEGMNILCALNGDMLAYDEQGAWDVMAICNGESSWVGDLMVATGATYTPDLVVQKVINPSSSSSDHRSFWNAGFTSTWLFEGSDSSPYIHSTQDVVTSLNFPFYVEATKVFLATLAIMADDQISVDVPGVPSVPSVALRHYPEPATGTVVVSLYASGTASGRLRIYDVSGRVVANLGEPQLSLGANRIEWNGRMVSGELAPSGVYLIRLELPGDEFTRRLTLIR